MSTVLELLRGLSAYPVPLRAMDGIAVRHGLTLTDEAAAETVAGKAYNLCKAEVLLWLSLAPDISQGGQSYSFTDEQRKQFRIQANALFGQYGDAEADAPKTIYGYKGSRL